MAGKKKKAVAEIVELHPNGIGTQEAKETAYKDVFPDDDPRNGMSKEQMLEFERKEQEELERRMSRFMKDTPKPDTGGVEDDEEEEIFTLDLSTNKITKVEEESLIVIDSNTGNATIKGNLNIEGMLAQAILPPPNPYAELITNLFTAKALTKICKNLRDAEEKLRDASEEMPHIVGKDALAEAERKIRNQIEELRRAWIMGTSKVNYDKIPAWADRDIKHYIEIAVGELLILTSGG